MNTKQTNGTHPELSVTFWGVRGSLAAPGASTQYIGGNTSCVEVSDGETTLIFDAGTGIRALGSHLIRSGKKEAHLLFSHLHWDHIQGFPFFAPVYVPGFELRIHGPAPEETLRESLARQMEPPNFPIRFSDLKSQIRMSEVYPGTSRSLGKLRVSAARLHHPGGVLGYRVDLGDHAVVYSTDHEHGTDADARLVELARGADILIYDAMYTPEEYAGIAGPPKVGWGHSTYEKACEVALEAGVGTLVLFHHDPERSDAQVGEIVERARRVFPRVLGAREGLTLRPEGSPMSWNSARVA